jgi:hypothetical protein
MFTDVSKEHIASTFRNKELAKQVTSKKQAANRTTLFTLLRNVGKFRTSYMTLHFQGCNNLKFNIVLSAQKILSLKCIS